MKITKNIILGLGAISTSLVLASTVLSCASNPNHDLKKLNIKPNYPEFDNPLILNSGEIEILKNNIREGRIILTDQNLNDIFPILTKLFNFFESDITSTKLLEWNRNETIIITAKTFTDSSPGSSSLTDYGQINFRLRQNVNGVSTDYNFINGKPYSGISYLKSR